MTNQIKVLVVDDSAIMRSAIKRILEQDPRISVISIARNGQEAVEKVYAMKPDIVTMDIEMPVMDGLTALRHIMAEYPIPVIMVSSLTSEGAEATFQALELGAVDYVPKGGDPLQSLNTQMGSFMLRQKVRAIGSKNFKKSYFQKSAGFSRTSTINNRNIKLNREVAPTTRNNFIQGKSIVAIGTSTGGPMALQKVISALPSELPAPVLIVQHMPPAFIEPFAQRLDSLAKVAVRQSVHDEILEPGTVYIGEGGVHLTIKKASISRASIVHKPDTANSAFIPSVDEMMLSVASVFGKDVLGIIMTGMGSDGLRGMKLIKERGGATLAQDEASCVVYGMPKVCVETNIIDKIVPLERIGAEIVSATNRQN